MILRTVIVSVCAAMLCIAAVAEIPSTAVWPEPKISKGENPAIVAAPRIDWVSRVQATMERTKGKPFDLIFDGDSITDFWPSAGKGIWTERYGARRTANFAISGDKVEHLLWRLQQGQVDGMDPKVVVLMIGTNNTPRDSAGQIAEGIATAVSEYLKRCPRAHLVLMALMPRAERPDDPFRVKVGEVNREIAKLASDRVTVLDIGAQFLKPDGTIIRELMPDFLHPSAKGYEIWADALQLLIDRYAGKDPLAPYTRSLPDGKTLKVVKCYPNGLMRAYGVSFDDGKLASDKLVIECLRQRSIPASFMLNSEHPQSQDSLAHPEEYAGFEIASHGAHHQGLIGMPLERALEEITQDRKTLGSRFGASVEGFAYAYGAIPADPKPLEEAARREGILYMRGTTATGAFRPPADFMRWDPDCGFFSLKNLDLYLSLPAENSIRVMTEFAHSIDFANGNMPLKAWEQYLDRLAAELSIWKQPLVNIARYVNALRALSISDEGICNSAALPVWVRVNGTPVEISSGQLRSWDSITHK